MYTAAISVKLIILSGTSFNSISKIELQDFDIKAKTIKINGYELHLPIDLYLQLKNMYEPEIHWRLKIQSC